MPAAMAEMPARVRLQCAACKTVFGVRRPGAPPVDAANSVGSLGANPPTFVAFPVPGPAGASVAGSTSATVNPSVARRRGADEPGFAPGELLAGRYRVVRFIARGGMGEVFEVEDLELKERVALKTVRWEAAQDAVAVERFRREIQLARKVTHPNVCRIFDVSHHREAGSAEATIFLTMELLPGETLSQRLRRAGSMLPGEALEIARQIAEALDAAHRVGVVHRDLKPGNVVLVEGRGAVAGRGPRAVVTDFGLARLDSGAEPAAGQALTLTGAAGVVGTPAYLAPEQVDGGEITAAADVFAFGIVLYEMLTGTVPFLGENALSTAVKRLREAPVPPRVHAPGIEPRWEAAILRCLERDPADRFASAPEVIRALDRPLETATVLTPRLVPEPSLAPARTRTAGSGAARRRLQIAALAALVLAAVGVGWVRYGQWREKQAAALGHLPLPATDITPRRSVAVLGFKDLSGQSGTAWLSSALSEMLSTELGAGGGLRVVAGENVARAKVELGLGAADSLARDTLGRVRTLLGSDAVVLGSYVAVGGGDLAGGAGGRQIRLDVRLQDTRAGGETTTLTEAGSERQLFDLVSRVGKRLRRQLGAEEENAAGGDARSALPASPEAARLYSEGIERLRLFDPVGARDLLARAVAAEPGNALSHSALATAWNALGYDARARDEAKAAFDLAANLPREERLLIEGRYREVTQDWDHAIQTWWKLWSLFPDDLDYGLRLAAVQTDAGRVADALATTAALRTLPAPTRDDPRIDLAEAMAAGAGADFKRQQASAARAAARGAAQGAPMMVAQGRLLECRALRNLGQPEPALAACEAGRRLHEQAGDRAGVAEALTHAANVLYDRGDLPGADRLYEQALATYRDIGNRGAEAGALNNIAVVLKSQGDLDRARQLYQQVLSISREIGSRGGEAYALNNLAGVLLRRGELDEAAKLFDQSLAIRREQQDRGGAAYALDNLGVVLRRKGDLPAARQRHEEALAMRREIGQKIGEVASLNNLGAVLLDQGELAAARGDFDAALALARQTGNKSAAAYSLFGLGEVLAREGNAAEARKRHEEALALRTQLGEKGTSAESQLALANVLLDAGDPARAAGLARAAAEELGRQGAASDQARALAIVAQAENARGNVAAARDAMGRASALIQGNQDLQSRLIVELAAARLARSDEPVLGNIAGQASRAGLLDLRLQAELALAQRAAQEDGGAKLAAVQKEAQGLGYGAIARKAGPHV
ncbi:MAG TPA: tetratricopeptide repeat protein [Thermoanaerobaculia bacterium]|jgi:tetratricopeptide (TPR) repeat protein/tRNA A-37 threonylcarbamoyl transferase component Bud32|nr:tetratricopeptide repeat protein [Thermoanaerobaculia bacterium]